MHFPHGFSQFLNILLAASVCMLRMVEGADAKENLVILRTECYTIAILHQRTKASEHYMMCDWHLWEDREGRNMREGGQGEKDQG